MPDDAIKELLVVENPRAIRLILSEKHGLILKQITTEERSISEIARMLSLNPGSVHYYLKELERQGLARQVRQEIKGGVVKKYYRASARRMVLAAPGFGDHLFGQPAPGDGIGELLVTSIERHGYRVPEAEREEAKELILRYDRLIKSLIDEIHAGRPAGEERDEPMINPASQLLVHIRALDDPELSRIHSLFHKLFQKVD
jgi:DNA-binding transcriptional ArsR family regulator